MLKLLLALTLVSCAYRQIDPGHPDDPVRRSSVEVVSACSWQGTVTSRGNGVLVTGRYVLTAAHVVECPTIPEVRVFVNGERYRFVVDREDSERDIARLELASAETFNIQPVPWRRPRSGELLVTITQPNRSEAGRLTGQWLLGASSRPGDSGAGVYGLDEALVGLIVGGDDGTNTFITPLVERWY